MNKIYGFGNALIDIEIRISEEQLQAISIPKGSMKHISQDELSILLKDFKSQRYSALPGGSVANSLYAANQHGSKTFFSCSIGDDEYGEIFLKSFKDNDKAMSFFRSSLPTGICLIFVTPDGERTMAANLGANLDLCPESINISELLSSEFLILDNFSLSSKKGIETVEYSLEIKDKVRVCFGLSDISLIQENYENLKKVFLNRIDILYGNENEIIKLQELISNSAMNTLIGKGSKGAKYNQINIEASKIDVINSNGAGDALIGTFLAYTDVLEDRLALSKAVSYATKVCMINGPRLLT